MGVTGGKVYTVDATKIALESFGRNVPNTPILGALIAVTGLLDKAVLIHEIKKGLEKKFGAAVVQKNIEAIERACQEVRGDE